jgi:hypothetical protein
MSVVGIATKRSPTDDQSLPPGRLVLRAARGIGSSRGCLDHAEGSNYPYAIASPQFQTL